jgi:hypothetical protein
MVNIRALEPARTSKSNIEVTSNHSSKPADNEVSDRKSEERPPIRLTR